MSGAVIIRLVSIALIALAALIAVLGYADYAAGDTAKFDYAISFGGPLLIGIALQLFARANMRTEGSHDA